MHIFLAVIFRNFLILLFLSDFSFLFCFPQSALTSIQFVYSHSARAREIAMFTRRTVYSMINFRLAITTIDKTLRDCFSCERRARLSPNGALCEFRGSFYHYPDPRFYRRVKPLRSLERMDDFYLAVARFHGQ